MIRVGVRAQSAITQAGLEAILEADERFEVVRRATASPRIASRSPGGIEADVVLVEGGDSAAFSSVPYREQQLPAPPVVVLVDAPARSEVLRLLQAGVRGVLLRDAPPHEIAGALQAVNDGLAVVSPEILETMFPANAGPVEEEEPFATEPLTARESEVLALLAVGASNKEIATRLHVSEHTAKFHVSTILSKLGAATRAEAVARGYRHGLILI